MSTPNEKIKEIREKWLEKWKWDMSYQQESDLPEIIADYWIYRFTTLLEEIEEKIRESKREIPLGLSEREYEIIETYNLPFNSAKDSDIEIIKKFIN